MTCAIVPSVLDQAKYHYDLAEEFAERAHAEDAPEWAIAQATMSQAHSALCVAAIKLSKLSRVDFADSPVAGRERPGEETEPVSWG